MMGVIADSRSFRENVISQTKWLNLKATCMAVPAETRNDRAPAQSGQKVLGLPLKSGVSPLPLPDCDSFCRGPFMFTV